MVYNQDLQANKDYS